MTRNLEKLAIDGRERALLEKLPAATLSKVVDIKTIFGATSRVVGFKRGRAADDQLSLGEAQPAQGAQWPHVATANANGRTENDDEILRAWDEAAELPPQQEPKIDGGEAWKQKAIDERFTFDDEEMVEAEKADANGADASVNLGEEHFTDLGNAGAWRGFSAMTSSIRQL